MHDKLTVKNVTEIILTLHIMQENFTIFFLLIFFNDSLLLLDITVKK